MQITKIIDRIPRLGVQVIVPIAPVGNRHVVVDTDEIDIGIGPKRIEMEIPVVVSVLWLISKILGPVRRITDLGGASQ